MGGVGIVATLTETYDAGSSSSDQTMVLADAKGGEVVFDASGAGYAGPGIYKTIRHDGGVGMEVFWDGSVVLGDGHDNLLIGTPSHPVTGGSASHSVAMGIECHNDGDYGVLVGSYISSLYTGGGNVLVGSNMGANNANLNVGMGVSVQLEDVEGIGVGTACTIYPQSPRSIVMGTGAEAGYESDDILFPAPDSMAFGTGARVRGGRSMVFGEMTYTEESNKVLFDNFDGHVRSFTTFSSVPNDSDPDPEHPDVDTTMCPLFSFDESSIADPSSTSLTLLVKTSGGVDYFFPVKLTSPEMYTGICYLYIVES
jgi:hypothetical protein